MEKYNKAMKLAGLGMVCMYGAFFIGSYGESNIWGVDNFIGEMLSMIFLIIMLAGFVMGIASYFYAGFGQVMNVVKKILKWGLLIMPFPISLCMAPFLAIYAILIFMIVPIIPVWKARKAALNEYSQEPIVE